MMIVRDVDLNDFEFWGGAKQIVDSLTEEEKAKLFDWLDDDSFWMLKDECTPTEAEVNDYVWFEWEWILESCFGIEGEEAIEEWYKNHDTKERK